MRIYQRAWGPGLFFLFSVFIIPVSGQTVQLLTAHAPTSFRGLASVGQVLWVSGSHGTVGRSTDGGEHWTWIPVPGFERTDFRDIAGFDSNRAVIMGIDTPAVILRTTDGGAHWTVAFRDETPGMFLDAMDFSGDSTGMVVGDPIAHRFYLARTLDGGAHWSEYPLGERPLADSGEGCFASSGTNIAVGAALDRNRSPLSPVFVFVSGGPVSRIFRNRIASDHVFSDSLNLLDGAVSTGANSIAIYGPHCIVVGGDFQHDTISSGNALYSSDLGRTWKKPHTPPNGYRSCVIHLWGRTWLCCGTSGVDVSTDGGDHWTLLSRESFHVAAYPGSGKTVYLAGAKGRIAKVAF